jgi:hypothetical protein
MALGSTQNLTAMSTKNLPGDKGRPVRKTNNLTIICETECLENVGSSTSQNLWRPRPVTGIALPFYLLRCQRFNHGHPAHRLSI